MGWRGKPCRADVVWHTKGSGTKCTKGLFATQGTFPPKVITAAVDELTRDRSAMSMEAANREVYLLLKEGIKASVADKGRALLLK